MNDPGRTYLESRVLTASPAKLQWMLIDGALKSVRRAEERLEAGDSMRANVELSHAESILSEIVGAMRKDVDPKLVEQSAAIYAFVIRRLTEAHLSAEIQPVRDAARVLEIELETWRQVCEANTARVAPPPSHLFAAADSAAYQGGFTLDA